MEQLTIEVIPTSNYPGEYSVQTFDLLSPVWAGSSLCLPLRGKHDSKKKRYEVTGWDAVHDIGPTSIHVARVCTEAGKEGYVVYGNAAGVRVLDKREEVEPKGDEYLPPGHGCPYVWIVREDLADLPEEVRAVVEQDADATET